MDTFFMMSSFLMTRLILKARQQALLKKAAGQTLDRKSTWLAILAAFYQRRLRRLIPALVLLVCTVALAELLLGRLTWRWVAWPPASPNIPGDTAGPLGYLEGWGHLWAALLMASNWLRAWGIPHNEIIGHTWSLAVEEQFYLVWPALLLALNERQRWLEPLQVRKHIRWVALGLISLVILSWLWRAWLTAHWTDASGQLPLAGVLRLYNGTDMRLDALALGAVLAWLGWYAPDRFERLRVLFAHRLCLSMGMFLLALACLKASHFSTAWYLWQQTLYVLVSCVVLVGLLPPGLAGEKPLSEPSANNQNPLPAWLSLLLLCKPMQWLGLRSYGAYLWHYPLLYLCQLHWKLSLLVTFAICFPLTLMFAGISYRFIEQPLLGTRSSAA
jgi:peptidoglycan/LPS O-acetylase OafA/YrhL